MNSYLLFKSLHLIAVISWMAGLLYLPRIFVYHVDNKEKKEATDIFEVMEKKLFFYIMRPAMIFTWIFGLILIYLNGIEISKNDFEKKIFEINNEGKTYLNLVFENYSSLIATIVRRKNYGKLDSLTHSKLNNYLEVIEKVDKTKIRSDRLLRKYPQYINNKK